MQMPGRISRFCVQVTEDRRHSVQNRSFVFCSISRNYHFYLDEGTQYTGTAQPPGGRLGGPGPPGKQGETWTNTRLTDYRRVAQ